MLQITIILITLLILTPTTNPTLIIETIDSTSGYTEIKIGETDMVLNYDTVLHIINLQEIKNIIDQLEQNIITLRLDTTKTTILHFEIKKLRSKLRTLIPHRHRRGVLNIIGTIQKWLYGTMDNEDRENIERHLNVIDINNHNIIGEVNQQVRINKNFNETFTRIKDIIEGDRKIIKEKTNEIVKSNNILFTETKYIDYLLKIKILSDSISNIQDNIASSRIGIIHSNILTVEEIDEYQIDLIKLKNLKLGTLVDNKNNIIFVIMIPKETIKLEISLITPIANNKYKELELETEKIVRFKNITYIYNENKDLKNQKTLKNCLIKKNCVKHFNNDPEIFEIDRGTILLKNQKDVNLTSTCDQRRSILNGNYLLNFHNCSIKIDQFTIHNNEKNFKQTFIIPNNNENIENIDSKLSFENIALNQIENIKEIKELKFHKKLSTYTGISITIVITITIIIITILLYYKSKKIKVNINNITKENPTFKEQTIIKEDKNNKPSFNLNELKSKYNLE